MTDLQGRRPLLLLVLSAWLLALPAQPFWSGQYYMSQLSLVNGLPHHNVNQMFCDSEGFMWVSTYGGGVVRYDGYTFEPMDYGHPSGSISNSCRGVTEDRFHRLWITYDEGTDILDLKTRRHVLPQSKDDILKRLLRKPSVRVYCDSKGGIWHVMADSIMHYTFDKTGAIAQMAAYRYRGNTPDISICDVEQNGTVWCGIDNGLYRLLDNGSQLVRRDISPVLRQLSGYFVTDLLKVRNIVWIATNHGLYAYDQYNNTLRGYHHTADPQSLSHEYATSLAVALSGRLLVGTLRGLDFMDMDSGRFDHWNSTSGGSPLPSDFIHCLLTHDGQIWIGTETAGIIRLLPRPFLIRSYTHQEGQPASLSANPVNAMYVDHQGTLWAGTVEGGLNRRTPRGDFDHWTTQNSALSHNSVSVLEGDDAGRLWIGTWGGGLNVISLDGHNTLEHIPLDAEQAEQVSHIGALAYDRRNHLLWIGANEGVYIYNPQTRKLEAPFAVSNEVRGCIGTLIDKSGKLWMGCITGVCVVDLATARNAAGQFKVRRLRSKLDQPGSPVVDKICCFCLTRDGTLWLGSSYGLYRRVVDDKSGQETFAALTTADGLVSNAVKGIVEDVQGRLWITTNNGLSIYDSRARTFINYNVQDGLPCDQFYWNSAVRDTDGTLYFGSVNGLIEVRGENADYSETAHMTFTRLMVNNQEVTVDDGDILDADIAHASRIRLHESAKSLAIEFSSLTYSGHVRGYYSYRMRGFERDWIPLRPDEHSVRYTNLPPGDYTFEVKFTSEVGDEKSQVIAINIFVSPYFWKSWWFLLLLILVVASALWWLQRTKMEAWRRREAESLLQPIKKVLEESDSPDQLKVRIHNILGNQELLRQSQHRSAEADKQNAMKGSKPFMEQVTDILEKNYMNSAFGVTEFADAIGMSKTLLSKRLNAETGQSTGQFIRGYRLNIAKRMILENPANLNITEIAYRVGFNDPKYFTRCFTNMYGSPPKTFKE